MSIEGGDPRIQIQREIRDHESRIRVLSIIIDEGNTVESEIREGKFWPLLKRTMLSLDESYRLELFECVKTPGLSPDSYIGRMECIDNLVKIVEHNFLRGREAALSEKEILVQRIKELREILDGKNPLGYTGGTGES